MSGRGGGIGENACLIDIWLRRRVSTSFVGDTVNRLSVRTLRGEFLLDVPAVTWKWLGCRRVFLRAEGHPRTGW